MVKVDIDLDEFKEEIMEELKEELEDCKSSKDLEDEVEEIKTVLKELFPDKPLMFGERIGDKK